MFRVNGTAKGPGVICAGEKLHVAPAGNVLCRQESVMAYLGSPVLAFNWMAYVAVPPGDVAWGAGGGAVGAAEAVTTSSRMRELFVSATYRLPLESPATP